MPVYEIRGIEEEAGITTSIPIKAKSEGEAIAEARREGIADAHVVGRHGASPEEMEQDVEMRSNELIEKTGPAMPRRVMFGWVLLLIVLPVFVTLTHWLGARFDVANESVMIIDAIGLAVIILMVVQVFGRYWGRGKKRPGTGH